MSETTVTGLTTGSRSGKGSAPLQVVVSVLNFDPAPGIGLRFHHNFSQVYESFTHTTQAVQIEQPFSLVTTRPTITSFHWQLTERPESLWQWGREVQFILRCLSASLSVYGAYNGLIPPSWAHGSHSNRGPWNDPAIVWNDNLNVGFGTGSRFSARCRGEVAQEWLRL